MIAAFSILCGLGLIVWCIALEKEECAVQANKEADEAVEWVKRYLVEQARA
jgi:hypothetical protein